MLSEKERRTRWLLLNGCLLGGALLTFIGIRYFLVPHAAARTFGVPGRPTGFELHYVLGLRNVWLGLLAPKGTPRPIIERLHREVQQALATPEVKTYMANSGIEIVGSTPEEFDRFFRAEKDLWAKVVRATGAKID